MKDQEKWDPLFPLAYILFDPFQLNESSTIRPFPTRWTILFHSGRIHGNAGSLQIIGRNPERIEWLKNPDRKGYDRERVAAKTQSLFYKDADTFQGLFDGNNGSTRDTLKLNGPMKIKDGFDDSSN